MLEQPGSEPGTLNPGPPAGSPRTAKAINPWLTGLVGLTAGAAIGLAIGFWPTPAPVSGPSAGAPNEAISAAVQTCQLTGSTGITLMDGGNSVELETAGKESAGAPYTDVVCVLDGLKMPESVKARIGTTRSLDGMQQGTWPGYAASWNYHPDNGLNIIVEAQDAP